MTIRNYRLLNLQHLRPSR